jgi:hypothetical protein
VTGSAAVPPLWPTLLEAYQSDGTLKDTKVSHQLGLKEAYCDAAVASTYHHLQHQHQRDLTRWRGVAGQINAAAKGHSRASVAPVLYSQALPSSAGEVFERPTATRRTSRAVNPGNARDSAPKKVSRRTASDGGVRHRC